MHGDKESDAHLKRALRGSGARISDSSRIFVCTKFVEILQTPI
jgi:hypothetical protein